MRIGEGLDFAPEGGGSMARVVTGPSHGLGLRTRSLAARAWRRLTDTARPPNVATFWHGPLDPLIYTCLASFPHHGARLRLYAYDAVEAPSGVEVRDAREICPDLALVDRFISDGRVALAKFANLFRYRMIASTGLCWVDADMLCLKTPDFWKDEFVFGQQEDPPHHHLINVAALNIPRRHPMLAELIDQAAAAIDIDQSWGATGPALLTALVAKHELARELRPKQHFYPVHWSKFWLPLLRSTRGEVDGTLADAKLLHLWHEAYRTCGYDKQALPPEGSYFADMCRALGTSGRFRRQYDEGELRTLLRLQDGAGDR